jgi:hypothetical protein
MASSGGNPWRKRGRLPRCSLRSIIAIISTCRDAMVNRLYASSEITR